MNKQPRIINSVGAANDASRIGFKDPEMEALSSSTFYVMHSTTHWYIFRKIKLEYAVDAKKS